VIPQHEIDKIAADAGKNPKWTIRLARLDETLARLQEQEKSR